MNIRVFQKKPTAIAKWIILLFLLTSVGAAQTDEIAVSSEVKPFVEKGRVAIALERGDLNGDGKQDILLVTSEVIPENAVWEEGAGERAVIILIRGANGALGFAARNDMVVLCRNCGGVFGDPFAGVEIRGTRFIVNNYGGSNDRWAYSYTFAYSRRDKTWQLTRVVDDSFHSLDPKRTTRRRVYTPPKNFGLINFGDFDPDNFLGKGKK